MSAFTKGFSNYSGAKGLFRTKHGIANVGEVLDTDKVIGLAPGLEFLVFDARRLAQKCRRAHFGNQPSPNRRSFQAMQKATPPALGDFQHSCQQISPHRAKTTNSLPA